MGHKDLANFLSRTVYHEKSKAVQELLLNDPFKKEIHTNSPLLDEAAFVPGPTGLSKTPDKLSRTDYFGISVGVIAFIAILISLWIWLSPYYCKRYRYGIPEDKPLDEDQIFGYDPIDEETTLTKENEINEKKATNMNNSEKHPRYNILIDDPMEERRTINSRRSSSIMQYWNNETEQLINTSRRPFGESREYV